MFEFPCSHCLYKGRTLALANGAYNASWCRLMEAAAWGCARWADSYLMSDEPASEGLQASFGAKGGAGPHIVAVLLQAAITLLSR